MASMSDRGREGEAKKNTGFKYWVKRSRDGFLLDGRIHLHWWFGKGGDMCPQTSLSSRHRR